METTEVTQQQLEALLQDPDTPQSELLKYFKIDERQPFHPTLVLRDEVIIVNEDGIAERGLDLYQQIVNLSNRYMRGKRNKRYDKMAATDRIRVVTEGDSWFQHPLVLDTIDHLSRHFAVYSLGAATDQLRNMHLQAEYLDALDKVKPRFLLLSAGGNDILGSQFYDFLNEYEDSQLPGEGCERFMSDSFHTEMKGLHDIYEDIFCSLEQRHPELDILLHGYDYIIPNNPHSKKPKKSWLGAPMLKRGIENDKDKQGIIRVIIDQFNDMLEDFSRQHDRVHYINVRNQIAADQWYDEIHPTAEGFQMVALRFKEKMNELLASA